MAVYTISLAQGASSARPDLGAVLGCQQLCDPAHMHVTYHLLCQTLQHVYVGRRQVVSMPVLAKGGRAMIQKIMVMARSGIESLQLLRISMTVVGCRSRHA